MADDDWKRRFVDEFHSNPVVAASVLGAAGAVLGLMLAAQNLTPDDRRAFKRRQAERKREYVRSRRERDRDLLLGRLQREYFENGRGKDLYEQRARIRVPADAPFPDGTFERKNGRYGGPGFVAASEGARVQLQAVYDTHAAQGWFRLTRPDQSTFDGGAGFRGSILRIGADEELGALLDGARLMAKLIGTPGSFCSAIEVLRPDHWEIREAIWREYLQENPHVATTFGGK